jgi:hypothetical protein
MGENMATYFHVSELVPPNIFNRFGEQRSWNFVNKRAFDNLVKFREYVGHPFIINNYRNGGPREWSGLRNAESPYYSQNSQHSFANAYDIQCPYLSPEELQNIVKEVYRDFEIGGLEIAPTWTHIDWRYNLDGSLTIFHI